MGNGVGERFEFAVGRLQLRGAPVHPLLELGVQPHDLLLRSLALGDVLQCSLQPAHAAMGIPLGFADEAHPQRMALGRDDLRLDVERASATQAGLERGADARAVGGRDEPHGLRRGRREAGFDFENRAGLLRPLQRLGADIPGPGAQAAHLCRQMQHRLRVAQAPLGELALGDVLHLRDEEKRPPVEVARERAAEVAPDGVAAAVTVAVLAAITVLLAGEQRGQLAPDVLHVVGMDDIFQRHAQQLALRVAEEFAEGAVHGEPPLVRSQQRHADHGVLERPGEVAHPGFPLRGRREFHGIGGLARHGPAIGP